MCFEEKELSLRERIAGDSEVVELYDRMFADGVISDEEVEELWGIKDKKDGDTSSDFDKFFAAAVVANIMADGVFTEEEAQKYADKINEDDSIDDAETAFLELLAEKDENGEIEVPNSFKVQFEDFFTVEEEEDEDE